MLIGVLAFFLQPGPPPLECAPDSGVTSGFYDGDKNCPISIESMNEYGDYSSSPKPFRIAGLVLVLAGLVVAVVGLFRKPKNRGSGDPAAG